MSKLIHYEKAGLVIRFWGWINFGVFVGLTLYATITIFTENTTPALAIVFASVSFVISIIWLVIGQAIKKHKEWGRIAGIIIGIPPLIGFPVGTLIGGYIIWCLVKGWEFEGCGDKGVKSLLGAC